jgi:hypothetical protein
MISVTQLEEFRSRMDPVSMTEKQNKFCDDACLHRYLVAHKNNLENAVQGLKATLAWREEFGVDKLSLEDIESEAIDGAIYTNGFDKENRPLIYIKKKDHVGDPLKGVKLLVYTLEHAIRKMPKGVEQWVIVFDMEKYARANAAPFHISKMTVDIFANHYPERLAFAYFTFTPWIYGVFYTLLSPFIDAKTKGKLHIIGTQFEPLIELVDGQQLETKYGGALEFMFDYPRHYQ